MRAARDVSFALGRERLGIVGESGSGKSTTGRAILGLIPPPGVVRAQRLAFDGIDLGALADAGWSRLRGRRLAMVMQDPKFSLNPVMRVGAQIMRDLPPASARQPPRGRATRACDAGGGAHPRPRNASSASIRTSSPAAWASAS